MIRAIAVILALLFAGPALAQGCGASNPNCVVPLAPSSDSSYRAANTLWTRNLLSNGFSFFGINNTGSTLPTPQTGSLLQIGQVAGTTGRIEADTWAATSHFTGVRYDGTRTLPTTLQANDTITSFNAWGYNGIGVVGPAAALRCFAAANWTNAANSTYCDIATTPSGSQTLTQVMAFQASGGVTMGSPTGGDPGAGALNVAGGLYVNNVAAVTLSGTQTLTNKTLTSPVINGTPTGTSYLALTGTLVASASVNFNSANTDTAISILLPPGYSNYRVTAVIISGASASLSTATFGVFTATGGGGTAIVSGGTAITVTATATATNNNMQSVSPNNTSTQSYNATTVYFRVGGAQGSAATGTVTLTFNPVS